MQATPSDHRSIITVGTPLSVSQPSALSARENDYICRRRAPVNGPAQTSFDHEREFVVVGGNALGVVHVIYILYSDPEMGIENIIRSSA